jgi:hypothetical protein
MPLSRSCLSRLALFLLLCAFLSPLSRSALNAPSAHPPQAPLALTSAQQGQVRDLAARVLQKAGKADCKPRDCTILVPNFTLASGAASRLGMQLADQVSIELAAQQNAIEIIDRSRLQSFLEQERIPANLFNDEKAICWLGKQLGANAVLRGTTEDFRGPLQVQTSLLSCDKNKAGPVEEFYFSDSDPKPDLAGLEPFPKSLPSSDSSIPPDPHSWSRRRQFSFLHLLSRSELHRSCPRSQVQWQRGFARNRFRGRAHDRCQSRSWIAIRPERFGHKIRARLAVQTRHPRRPTRPLHGNDRSDLPR